MGVSRIACASVFGAAEVTEGGDAGRCWVAKGVVVSSTVSPPGRVFESIESSLDTAPSGAGDAVTGGGDADACIVDGRGVADEGAWATASSVGSALGSTRSDGSGRDPPSPGVVTGMLATISALVDAASSGPGDGATVVRSLVSSSVAKAPKTDARTFEKTSPGEATIDSLDAIAKEGDGAESGVGEGAAMGKYMDSGGVAKPATIGEGASETASPVEIPFETLELMASEGDVAASGIGVGVVAGRVMDACGIAKPATTGAVDSETASPLEPVFGSIDLAGSESDAALSGVAAGAGVGITMSAKADAGASKTASRFESEFELLGSLATKDDIAAFGVGAAVTPGPDRDACGITGAATTGAGASATASPFKPVFGWIGFATCKGDATLSEIGD